MTKGELWRPSQALVVVHVDLGPIQRHKNQLEYIDLVRSRIFEYLAHDKPVIISRFTGLKDESLLKGLARKDKVIVLDPMNSRINRTLQHQINEITVIAQQNKWKSIEACGGSDGGCLSATISGLIGDTRNRAIVDRKGIILFSSVPEVPSVVDCVIKNPALVF